MSLFRVIGIAVLTAACSIWVSAAVGQTPAKAQAARFVDKARDAGLRFSVTFGGKDTKTYIIETTGTGVATFDYNNDGLLDIFIVNGTTLDASAHGNSPTNHLFRNNGDGTFTDVTESVALTGGGWGQGVCVGDYDNDGWEDLFVTYYGHNRLLHNNHGKFEDVSDIAGVAGTKTRWGTGCAFVDYDRDGLLDMVVANYVDFDLSTAPKPGERASCMWKGAPVMCGPRGLKPDANILYHNLGNGKFEDVTAKAHIDETPGHYCFSISTLDYNDDGWPDLYVACDSTPSILYRNNRDGTFADVGVLAGAALNEDGREQAGMGSTIADYDGDGLLDIFRTNFSDDTSTLYRNTGKGYFSDETFAAGMGLHTQYLGWGTMFLDFDNDGWPDLLIINGHVYPEVDKYKLGSDYREPRLLFRNNGGGTFTDISGAAGPAFVPRYSGRGLAVADLWNDGKMSAVISNMNDPVSLLVNETRNANHWVAFRTVGTKSNRDGIGARVTVRAGGRVFVNEVRSGSSYISNSDMRLHFGLGAAAKIDSVEVRWPSGLRETFNNLAVDKIHVLTEGSGKAEQAAPAAKSK